MKTKEPPHRATTTLRADTRPQLFSLQQAATMLGVSLRSLYRLIARGDLPAPVKVGGSRKLFATDLENYFDSLRQNR